MQSSVYRYRKTRRNAFIMFADNVISLFAFPARILQGSAGLFKTNNRR